MKIKVNHDGETINEIIHLTRAEEVEVMLDKEHELHNKLILIYFLTTSDRGAVSVAMLAIANNALPENLKASSTVEAIMNADDSVVNTLVGLFEIGNYFTSDTAKAEIKLLIEKDDALKILRTNKEV